MSQTNNLTDSQSPDCESIVRTSVDTTKDSLVEIPSDVLISQIKNRDEKLKYEVVNKKEIKELVKEIQEFRNELVKRGISTEDKGDSKDIKEELRRSHSPHTRERERRSRTQSRSRSRTRTRSRSRSRTRSRTRSRSVELRERKRLRSSSRNCSESQVSLHHESPLEQTKRRSDSPVYSGYDESVYYGNPDNHMDNYLNPEAKAEKCRNRVQDSIKRSKHFYRGGLIYVQRGENVVSTGKSTNFILMIAIWCLEFSEIIAVRQNNQGVILEKISANQWDDFLRYIKNFTEDFLHYLERNQQDFDWGSFYPDFQTRLNGNFEGKNKIYGLIESVKFVYNLVEKPRSYHGDSLRKKRTMGQNNHYNKRICYNLRYRSQ